MFHTVTAIVLISAYAFANKKMNKFLQVFLILIVFMTVTWTNIPQRALEILVSLVPKYTWYLDSKFVGNARTSYGLLGPIIKTSIVITLLLFKDQIIEKFPMANIHLNLLFLYQISYLFKLDIAIFGRIEHIFIFSLIISLVFFLKTIQKNLRPIAISLLMGFYFLMFMRYITNGTVNIDNSVHVSPYQTIFSR